MTKKIEFGDDGEALFEFTLAATNSDQKRYLLHAMDVFEKIRHELGNFTVTAGKGKDRLLFLTEPITSPVEGINNQQLVSVTFIAVSQRGFYGFHTTSTAWNEDWTQNPLFLSDQVNSDRVILQIAQAVRRNGKVKDIKVAWERREQGLVPVLDIRNPDHFFSLPGIRILFGEKKFIGNVELFPVDAKVGIAHINDVKEKILGFREAKTSQLELVDDAAHDFANEAGIQREKQKHKHKRDEED